MKNKLTMFEYELRKLEKEREWEKSVFSAELEHLGRELYSRQVMLSQMAARNEELVLENIALKSLSEVKAEASKH